LYLKWFDDAEWVKCSVAGKQPRQKRKDPTSWRGWYVLVFDAFESSEAFDLLSLARHGRVRYQKAPSKANLRAAARWSGVEWSGVRLDWSGVRFAAVAPAGATAATESQIIDHQLGQARVGAPSLAVGAEIMRRGLVRQSNDFTSRHKGVNWSKTNSKWRAEIKHGGKQEHLGYFVTEEEAKARYDARHRELGQDQVPPDTGTSSDFRGVCWAKAERKWKATIKVDGRQEGLGRFALN
jgi:hypothetical protein